MKKFLTLSTTKIFFQVCLKKPVATKFLKPFINKLIFASLREKQFLISFGKGKIFF